ncbi:MAG: phytanoyl-CoA dioxygenase family protein [Myxococcales bacterium]|nr:phytanoyl-CoA dioxygenase family protein [Myxococcales bacterium]
MMNDTLLNATISALAAARVPWKDLDARGYVVVPGFLNAAELDGFRADYEAADRAASAHNAGPDAATRTADAIDVPYKVRHVTPAARAAIEAKLNAVAATVSAQTAVQVNSHAGGPFGNIYFTTGGDRGLSWHQDSVSYYAYQNHHDYVNFYMPIVKPERARSNLSVIPFDALAARSPALASRVRGKGATRFVAKDGQTVVHDNDGGGKHGTLPYLLDEIAATPELDAGDLLLLRGDMIHRTQDTSTRRIAVSLRMMNASTRVRRAALVRGGLVKTLVMVQLRKDFSRLFASFAAAGRDELSVEEMSRFEAEVEPRAGIPSQTAFLRFLLWNRLRARLRA